MGQNTVKSKIWFVGASKGQAEASVWVVVVYEVGSGTKGGRRMQRLKRRCNVDEEKLHSDEAESRGRDIGGMSMDETPKPKPPV